MRERAAGKPATANEDLLAANEELRIVNEELQIAKEELQAHNHTTKRALAEKDRLLAKLRAERGVLDVVAQQIPAGVVVAEAPSGRVLFANRQMVQVPERGFHPDSTPYRPEDWPLARAIAAGERVAGEQILVERADGSYAMVMASAAPVRDDEGRVIAGVTAFMDVSDEVAERLRRQREQQLLGATAMLLDPLDIDKTLQRAARLVVPGFADWCVLDLVEQEEVIRQAAAAHVDEAKEALARELARRSASTETPFGAARVIRTGSAEIQTTVPNDAWLAAALSLEGTVPAELEARSYVCVPLKVGARVLGALTLVRADKSDLYGPQDLELAEELGRRIGLAIENARLYHTAMEAVRARNEFFAIASHELKTPMSVLLLQVQGLRRSTGSGAVSASQGKSLDLIERQVRRLDQLVNTLLDASRIAAGSLALEVENLDCAEVVKEVVSRLDTQIKRAGVQVSVSSDGPALGRWDRLRLEQVVTNVVSNAIKYGAGKPIEIAVECRDGAARIVVKDHGIGIAKEDLARIFEQFERAVPIKHYAGLGMGLFIARQIVEAHGGKIEAESTPGAGSTFTVELPLAGPPGRAS